MRIINNSSYIKVRRLISRKRDEDKLKYIEQSGDNKFAVINDKAEASEISKNNNIIIDQKRVLKRDIQMNKYKQTANKIDAYLVA